MESTPLEIRMMIYEEIFKSYPTRTAFHIAYEAAYEAAFASALDAIAAGLDVYNNAIVDAQYAAHEAAYDAAHAGIGVAYGGFEILAAMDAADKAAQRAYQAALAA